MGFLGNSDRVKYVHQFQGKFTLKAQKGEEGAKMRTNKLGTEVWEHQFSEIEGCLVDVIEKDSA